MLFEVVDFRFPRRAGSLFRQKHQQCGRHLSRHSSSSCPALSILALYLIFFVAPRVLQQRLPDCLRLVSHSWHAVDDQEGSHLAPALEETSEC